MKPIILAFYISIAFRVHSAMVGLQAMVPPAYVSPPVIYGCGTAHTGAASAIKWCGGIPERYQRSHQGQFAGEILSDVNHQEEVLSDNEHAKEFTPDGDQEQELLNPSGSAKELMFDDHQQKGFLSPDSRPIQEKNNLCDCRKRVSQSPTLTAPTIEPPMQRTVYTKEQMKHLRKQIKYRTQGFNYKYDLEHDNFYQLDKSDCDCSGYCGRIKIFDSVHPEQLVYETPCCYCGGRWRTKYQANLGESCLSLAVLCPLITWWKAQSYT
ncbi:secreted protein [Melampsora americana]|nr:secreted protein [Melampsora americana]